MQRRKPFQAMKNCKPPMKSRPQTKGSNLPTKKPDNYVGWLAMKFEKVHCVFMMFRFLQFLKVPRLRRLPVAGLGLREYNRNFGGLNVLFMT
jgi:hypothetical protein